MKRKIYISAGHSNVKGKDRGATAFDNSITEGEMAVELRNLICEYLKDNKIDFTIDSDSNVLKDSLAYLRGLVESGDIAIDIHFNSAISLAIGTEVLVPDKASPFETKLASNLSKSISSAIGIPNRGVKDELLSHRGKLGWMRLNCENILIEVCFISNKTDFDKYQYNKQRVASAIAQDIIQAYNS